MVPARAVAWSAELRSYRWGGEGALERTGRPPSTRMLADSLAAVLHVAVQHMLKIVVVDPGALHFAARVSSGAGGGRRAALAQPRERATPTKPERAHSPALLRPVPCRRRSGPGRHPELKDSTPAHTKHLGWYVEFEFRVTHGPFRFRRFGQLGQRHGAFRPVDVLLRRDGMQRRRLRRGPRNRRV